MPDAMVPAKGGKRTAPQGPVFPRERCWAGARWTQSRLAVVRDRGKVLGGKAPSRVGERALATVPHRGLRMEATLTGGNTRPGEA